MRKLCVLAFVCLTLPLFSQTTVAPLIVPRQQFFDANGKPLAGGKVYFYAAGTSTPQATYVDYLGVIQNSNPVILDSGGFGTIFLGPQSYKIVVQNSSGSQQWMQDNFQSFNGTISAVFNFTGTLTSATSNPSVGYILNCANGDLCVGIKNAANTLSLSALKTAVGSDQLQLGDTPGLIFPSFADFLCQNPAPAVSPAGRSRYYADCVTNRQYISENANPFHPVSSEVVLFASGTAGSALANTTTETAMYTADTTHIPANTITATTQIIKATFGSKFSTTATPTLQTRFRLDTAGGTLILDAGSLTTTNNAANLGSTITATCVFTAVGVGGSMTCVGVGGITGGTSASPSMVPAPTVVAFDTTVAHDFVPTEQWGTANASNTVAGQVLIIERHN